jgi:hypothetical protein
MLQDAFAVDAPVAIHVHAGPALGDDGRQYTLAVYGQPRRDGTSIGWLEFVPDDAGPVRRTGRETTPPAPS